MVVKSFVRREIEANAQCATCEELKRYAIYDPRILRRNSACITVLSSMPKELGHVNIIPKKHYRDISEIPPSEYVLLMNAFRDILSAITNGLTTAHSTLSINTNSSQFKIGAKGHVDSKGRSGNHLVFEIVPILKDPHHLPLDVAMLRTSIMRGRELNSADYDHIKEILGLFRNFD